MYALQKYVEVTGDDAFLFTAGAEMLVETARMWFGLGFFSERREGKFCIHGVTGPDEYTTVVDDNLYTNLMAQNNLSYAADTVEALRQKRPEAFFRPGGKDGPGFRVRGTRLAAGRRRHVCPHRRDPEDLPAR